MSRCLCALIWALLVVPLSAGTVTVDFTPRDDGLISVPSFLNFLGNTRGGWLSNSTQGPQTIEAIELSFNAGDAPLSLTADFFGEATLSPGCEIADAGGSPQFTCESLDGHFLVMLTAPYKDDPLGPSYGGVALDNIVITGDDVSLDDMRWVPTQTPEPSTFALAALLLVGVVSKRAVLRK